MTINPIGQVVGALACQTDSYLKTFDTEVISCVKFTPPTNEKSKKKRSSPETDASNQDTWLIECLDSVLFPEGGGQPCDHGILSTLDDPNQDSVQVANVQRQGLRCVIYSPKPLLPGTRVRQQVDWARRFDHMQQHTGQHLLCSILERKQFGIQTLGWGMGAVDWSYVDLSRKPTEEEMQTVQRLCAESILENHPITVETPEDAKHDSLPDDYDRTNGVIRVIKIGDIDKDPCCGTHLSTTGQISLILFGSTQSVHGKHCRLFFATGDRALRLAQSSVDTVRSMANLMSSSSVPDELLNRASQVVNTGTELRRSEKRLLMEIAAFEADRVKSIVASGKNALVQRADGGIDFINRVVTETKDALKGTGLVLIVAVGQVKASGPVVVVGDKEAVHAMAAGLMEVVKGVKGGGSGERWQGKVAEWSKEGLKALEGLVRAE